MRAPAYEARTLLCQRRRCALPADFRDGGRAELSKFSVLMLVTVLAEGIDDDGGVGGGPSNVYKTFTWCNACSCPALPLRRRPSARRPQTPTRPPAQVAQLAYNTALTLQRFAEGDKAVDIVALSESLENMTERMIKFSGAAVAAGGARCGPLGSHRKAARSSDAIERDWAEGVPLHAMLSPSEMLARLVVAYPLPAGPLRPAILSNA